MWNASPNFGPNRSDQSSQVKPLQLSRPRHHPLHWTSKVPVGNGPYARAKQVQLLGREPEKAIPLLWAAINAGDRVDSALKGMAMLMSQHDRAPEAIEAIKSLRHRCTDESQESLDNILSCLYQKCGRWDEQIQLLRHKLHLIQQGVAFNLKHMRTTRSQRRKFQISVEKEESGLLGNLGWALMQINNYSEAETAYRRSLLKVTDNNRMCNLSVCLMKQGRIAEAKEIFDQVKPALSGGSDSYMDAYKRAQQMLKQLVVKDSARNQLPKSLKRAKPGNHGNSVEGNQFWEPLPKSFKRMRVANGGNFINGNDFGEPPFESGRSENKNPRLSPSCEECWDELVSLLPDNKDLEDAIIAAVLGVDETGKQLNDDIYQKMVEKRLKGLQYITLSGCNGLT